MKKIQIGLFFLLNILLIPNMYSDNPSSKIEEKYLPKFCNYHYSQPDKYYNFIAPYKGVDNFLEIVDNYGTPVYIKQLKNFCCDFKIQENGYLTYYDYSAKKHYMMDRSFQVIDSFKVTSNYETDFHELLVLENNHVIMLGKKYDIVNMSEIVEGGQGNATVIDAIIQEFDENKKIIFEWNSRDHFDFTDSYSILTLAQVDYVHANSIDIDEDGNFILSSCYMSEVTKINRTTGDIIWRLGGKKNEFTFTNDPVGFSYQHSVRCLDNGTIYMFDNGNLNNLDYSRGLIYKLNTVNKTATVIKDFTHPQNISSNIMGNMQYLENNNMIIGWGGNENGYVLTEFSQTGEPIFDLIISNNFENYRAFRYPWKTTKFNSDIDSLNFGSVDYTNDSIIVVKITNNSEKMMELSGFSTSDTVFTVTNDFPLNINSNDFVELNIKFKPNKLGDNYEDILTINSDNYKNELFERIAIQINLHGYSPDIFPPEFISYPQDGSLDVSVDSTIIIKFNESIRFITNNEITNRNIQSFLKLRKGSLEGEVVDVAVIINEDKNEVTIKPKTHLECSENYYIVIENMIEDYNDNAFSETFFGFRTSNVSGVITNLENEIVLFPNPTKDLIKIKFNKKPQILKISNMNGELVYIDTKVQELNNYKVDFSDKNNGIYLVFILFDDGSINMSKFVKNE